jgi:hypothetical protein
MTLTLSIPSFAQEIELSHKMEISMGVKLTAISCASYPRFSTHIQKAAPSCQVILTVLEKLNLAKAFSVGEVVVSSNGHTKPGFIKISTN